MLPLVDLHLRLQGTVVKKAEQALHLCQIIQHENWLPHSLQTQQRIKCKGSSQKETSESQFKFSYYLKKRNKQQKTPSQSFTFSEYPYLLQDILSLHRCLSLPLPSYHLGSNLISCQYFSKTMNVASLSQLLQHQICSFAQALIRETKQTNKKDI